MKEKEPKTLEEKIDLILSYHRTMKKWAMVRGVISILLFLIFIVLPIIGGFYVYERVKSVDFSKLNNQYQDFQDSVNFLKAGSEQLKQFDF